MLDSHADTTCIGRNFRVISHTDKVCEVFPYHPGYESIQEAPIVQAAMAYDDPDSGETFILVVNQCLHLGDMMEHTLMNPNQLRANGIIVNDVPVHLATDPSKATHSIHVIKDDLVIPLTLKGIVSTFPTRCPSTIVNRLFSQVMKNGYLTAMYSYKENVSGSQIASPSKR